MQLLVFVTDDGSDNGTAPTLFLRDDAGAALPPNPRSFAWRYFATIGEEDALLRPDEVAARSAINRDGYFIANRLIAAHDGHHIRTIADVG